MRLRRLVPASFSAPLRNLVPALSFLAAGFGSPLAGTTITVNTPEFSRPSADDGFCTLYEAVAAANGDTASGALAGECAAGLDDDTIEFGPGTPAIYFLLFGELVVTDGLAILGHGSAALNIEAQGFHRIFIYSPTDILAAPTFELSGMTLSGGFATGDYNGFGLGSGGAILAQFGHTHLHDVVLRDNQAQDEGGAIRSSSRLTIERATFEDNANVGPILQSGGGGAINHNTPYDLTIRDSTFVGNSALADGSAALFDPHGGAIFVLSTGVVTIERSTFSANRARGAGGAISIGPHRTYGSDLSATLRHLTVVDNEADTDGDGIGGAPGVYSGGSAGGIFVTDTPGTTSLSGSIIAGNLDSGPDKAPDLDGFDFVSGGYNLVGIRRGNAAATFLAGQPNAGDDWVGTIGAPLVHGLLPLADNGGTTSTRLPDLAAASLAIDRGSCPAETADQRGYFNPNTGLRAVDEPTVPDADDACDIGAVELGAEGGALPFNDGFESGDTSAWSDAAPLGPVQSRE